MKKLTTKESLGGTRFYIQDERGNDLVTVDHLSFSGNKMKAKLFAGQLVNGWNRTYGEGAKERPKTKPSEPTQL